MLIHEKTFQLYVGADNFTHEVDTETLIKVLDERHSGYTIIDGTGTYGPNSEPVKVVTISDVPGQVIGTARKLRDLLNQDSIGVIELPPMQFV